jgi:hypothetical protein
MERARPAFEYGYALQIPHAMTLRFRRRKSLAGRRAHSLVNEPLEAPTVEVFADVDVSSAVDREGMRYVQRPAEDPLLSDVIDDLECLTQKNPDVVVSAVDHVKEASTVKNGRQTLWRACVLVDAAPPPGPSPPAVPPSPPLPVSIAIGALAIGAPGLMSPGAQSLG